MTKKESIVHLTGVALKATTFKDTFSDGKKRIVKEKESLFADLKLQNCQLKLPLVASECGSGRGNGDFTYHERRPIRANWSQPDEKPIFTFSGILKSAGRPLE